jgi:hypothetical protein
VDLSETPVGKSTAAGGGSSYVYGGGGRPDRLHRGRPFRVGGNLMLWEPSLTHHT